MFKINSINFRLKEIRDKERLSQASFGKRLKISQSQIASYETGYRNITDRTIKDVCREFNINEDWLLTGEGDMYNNQKTDEEFAFLMGNIAATDNPQLKTLINVLSQIDNEEDLDLILNLCKRLAADKED